MARFIANGAFAESLVLILPGAMGENGGVSLPTGRLFDGWCPDTGHGGSRSRSTRSANGTPGGASSVRPGGRRTRAGAWAYESVDLTVPARDGDCTLWRVDATELNASRGGVAAVPARYRAQTVGGGLNDAG